MRINLAVWDRIIRMLLGTALLGWAIAGGPLWAYFGLVFIGTAAWKFDPIYAIFRFSTLRS
ncbi:MAG: DUF2892 domain-containing protein [Proteobacteria bacterium]|nr:MAG: DUF2892 domain-containing protein [Pseudomonadota bacterium]